MESYRPPGHTRLSFSKIAAGRWLIEDSEAVAILNKGLGAHPDNHWILCSLALSHLSMGDRNRTMGEMARANLKASIKKFLPLSDVALLLFLKAFALKAPFFVGWMGFQASRLFLRSDSSISWTAFFGGLLAAALTIFYLIMLFSGLYSLRSSRFKHLPERLQS